MTTLLTLSKGEQSHSAEEAHSGARPQTCSFPHEFCPETGVMVNKQVGKKNLSFDYFSLICKNVCAHLRWCMPLLNKSYYCCCCRYHFY